MTSTQQYSIEGKDSEIVTLFVKLDLALVAAANTTVSAVTVFNRAFAAAPTVIGTNAPTPGVFSSAIATATAVSIYVNGVSDFARAAETCQVTCTLQGRLN